MTNGEDEMSELEGTIEDLSSEKPASIQGIKELFSITEKKGKSDIDLKTELDDIEIVNITAVEFITSLSNIDMSKEEFIIKGLTDKMKRLKVSRNRMGRGEAVDIFKSEMNPDIRSGSSWMKRLFSPQQR